METQEQETALCPLPQVDVGHCDHHIDSIGDDIYHGAAMYATGRCENGCCWSFTCSRCGDKIVYIKGRTMELVQRQ